MAADAHVLEEHLGAGLWRFTLAHPSRRNALNEEMSHAWEAAVARRSEDPATTGLVLAALGDDFCAGGDLGTMRGWAEAARRGEDVASRVAAFYRRFGTLLKADLPVVAAVRGRALGAGAALLLLCDAVVLSDVGSLQFNFARFGLHPGMGSTLLLPTVVGHRTAVRLLSTGVKVDAAEAASLGLATQVVPDHEVESVAIRTARELVSCGPVVRHIRGSVMGSLSASFDAVVELEAAKQAVVFGTEGFVRIVQGGLGARSGEVFEQL